MTAMSSCWQRCQRHATEVAKRTAPSRWGYVKRVLPMVTLKSAQRLDGLYMAMRTS